jgi:hypothetical protein
MGGSLRDGKLYFEKRVNEACGYMSVYIRGLDFSARFLYFPGTLCGLIENNAGRAIS